MARFTNFATLSYNGVTTDSNTVTGELLETLSVVKTAVTDQYTTDDTVTYVLSLINSGTSAITGITVTDDLGGYDLDTATLYPLRYTADSLQYYINGVLQTAPAVTAGPPMVISGISVPAGGNVQLVYETAVTAYAPLGTDAAVTNTVTLTGNGISTPLTAQETVTMESRADLTISKALYPSAVAENGQLTYTFVIANTGNAAATASDDVILTDTFNPILDPITVTFNGTTWTEGVHYTYDPTTGVFTTLAGQITVPAASYMQNPDGTWMTTPGTSTLVITGTV